MRPIGRGNLPGVATLQDISIALATYNGERFLAEQLASLVAQTLRPAELVVGDDGSSDATIALLEDFARTAPFPVRITVNENRLGHSDNFLAIVSRCRSPIVAYCDQDDVWLPDKLTASVARLTTDGSLLCLHTATITDGGLRPTGVLRQDIARDAMVPALTLFPYCTGWGMTMTFRRDIMELIARADRPAAPWMPKALEHDTWTYVLAAALGRVSHLDRPLILYRQHGTNTAGVQNLTSSEKIRNALNVPLHRYRGRARFYREVRDRLDAIAAAGGPFAAAARQAVAAYARLADAADARVRLYTAPRLSHRIGNLIACHRGPGRNLPSLAKDAALGVLRLGRISES